MAPVTIRSTNPEHVREVLSAAEILSEIPRKYGKPVIATTMLALAAGASDYEAAALANRAAGVVVGKVGTATCSPAELTAAVSNAGREES